MVAFDEDGLVKVEPFKLKCPDCNGSGEAMDDDDCPTCYGSGFIEGEEDPEFDDIEDE